MLTARLRHRADSRVIVARRLMLILGAVTRSRPTPSSSVERRDRSDRRRQSSTAFARAVFADEARRLLRTAAGERAGQCSGYGRAWRCMPKRSKDSRHRAAVSTVAIELIGWPRLIEEIARRSSRSDLQACRWSAERRSIRRLQRQPVSAIGSTNSDRLCMTDSASTHSARDLDRSGATVDGGTRSSMSRIDDLIAEHCPDGVEFKATRRGWRVRPRQRRSRRRTSSTRASRASTTARSTRTTAPRQTDEVLRRARTRGAP